MTFRLDKFHMFEIPFAQVSVQKTFSFSPKAPSSLTLVRLNNTLYSM